MHVQPNNKGPNMKLKYVYSNARMNCIIHHVTLKFSPLHMNYILVETWWSSKLLSATIYQKNFKKTHLLHISPLYIGTNYQACIPGTQQSKNDKLDEIGRIAKASIVPMEVEEFRTTDTILIMRDKGRCRSSNKLLIGADAYDTVRSRTVLPLHQNNTVYR